MQKSAILSPCGKYRYRLSRVWDQQAPAVCFIMLNPSTADAEVDDPTIRRCIGFAKGWGYGSIHVVNLFAFRATDPEDMKRAVEPVGRPDNDLHILEAVRQCAVIVGAWGQHGSYAGRADEVIQLLPGGRLSVIGLTKSGQPKHPLYLPGTSKPVRHPLYSEI